MAKPPIRHAYLALNDLRAHPDVAQALGDMVIAWAAAERALLEMLQIATGLSDEVAHVMYFRIPTFESRIKVLSAILAQWEPERDDPEILQPQDPAELARIAGKLASLSVTRNGWIHGRWVFSVRDGSLAIIDFREDRKSPSRRKPVKAADIRNHIEAVHKWTRKLASDQWGFRIQMRPRPSKPLMIEQPPPESPAPLSGRIRRRPPNPGSEP